MADARVTKLARLLVSYCTEIKNDDFAYIAGDYSVTKDLILAIYREVLRSGGHPFVVLGGYELSEIFYQEASVEQLEWISPIMDIYKDKLDAMFDIRGTSNTAGLNNIDPKKQQISAKAVGKAIMGPLMKRQAEGKLKPVVTLFPCSAMAQDAEMSLSDYENFVYSAMFCDREDPVEEWEKLKKKQDVLIKWLKGKEKVVIRGENVDLQFSIKERTFESDNGKVNMPGGEIYTGPVEDSVEGNVTFTYPAVHLGHVVENVHMTFEKGKVVHASADKNDEFLHAMLETDEGSSYLGEFGIGTNFGIQRFTKQMLFDEKIGGTFHLALGNGYPETGSVNESAIHWDMICELGKKGEIIIDDEPFFKDGKFIPWY